jgi:hypothetical protein
MIFPWGVILLIISVAVVSYAEMEKIAISRGNLTDLKGKWVGSRVVGPGTMLNTDLEIYNDSLPVEGKLTFYDVRRAHKAGTTEIVDFKGARINDQGNLVIKGPNVELELSLYKDDGKMKLEGNYVWMAARGTAMFKK